ncbi:chorismate-binding protein [Pseudokineococcus basanitobsidens]|uniref:Chorismate-binding protein n=1 Tax=Pseudokineococcus basanitobsidens TaxID=1926649 RepID=A0ABU8RHX0_9ACTN
MRDHSPAAWWGGLLATGLVEVVDLAEDPGALDRGGRWFVVADFEAPLGEASAVQTSASGVVRGRARAWRFADVRPAGPPAGGVWRGPDRDAWTSSLDRAGYTAAVRAVRDLVREGVVYQATVCRVLEAPLPSSGPPPGADRGGRPDAWALAAVLRSGNAARYAGVLDLGEDGFVVSASPELYLRRRGDLVESGPIKGTAPPGGVLGGKDVAENVMITDLVRNDLQRVCRPGTVAVTSLLARERHPGLDHLVSTVAGRLRPGTGWGGLLAATFPPGSVSGAPKRAALDAVAALEPVARGPYCGALGWVDADRGTGELAVGIRTFVQHDGVLRLGAGAGITWGSDPEEEWAETELKVARLLALASSPARRAP